MVVKHVFVRALEAEVCCKKMYIPRFGISKNSLVEPRCVNITLPGGSPITCEALDKLGILAVLLGVFYQGFKAHPNSSIFTVFLFQPNP